MLRQLRQRPIALDGGKRHLRLESRAWFRRGRLSWLSSSAIITAFRQKLHLSPCSNLRSRLCPAPVAGERIEFQGQRSIVSIHCKSNTLRVSFAEAIREHFNICQLRLNHPIKKQQGPQYRQLSAADQKVVDQCVSDCR